MEDFVTYEQAQTLRELGFYWRTTHYYDVEEPHEGCINSDSLQVWSGIVPFTLVSAPTLAQAAKWIRAKGLYIHVYLHLDDCWRFELQDVNYINKYIYTPEVVWWWRSYEKALSAGIDVALRILTYKNEEEQ